MNNFHKLILAGCLLGTAPLALACDVKHRGDHCDSSFHMMDKDGDGAISKKEFDAFHDQRFQELDANRDGKITQDEMDAQHKKRMEQARDPFDRRFDEVDINHDGALSKDEAEIGMPMLFKHFDEIDSNKDGKITKEEVIENMKKFHGKAHGKQGDDAKRGQ